MSTTGVQCGSHRFRPAGLVWCCVLLSTIALGCSEAGNPSIETASSSREYDIAFDSVPLVPRPPLTLHRTSRIARSSPDVALTLVQRLVVDARGNSYVDDWTAHEVPVVDPSGGPVRVVGREGSGPGEFRVIGDVDILGGDELLVYDPELERITVFAPGTDSVLTLISVPYQPPGPQLTGIRAAGGADPMLVGVYTSAYDPRNVRERGRVVTVRTLSMTGMVVDSILTFPYKENLVHISDGGHGFSVTTKPFGRRGFIRVGGDRIYYGWTDTVGVRTYSLRGEFAGGFKAAYERAEVTPADLDQALQELDERWARQALQENPPESWPAFEDFVVDDRGRAWFGITGEGGVTTRWDGFTPEGAYVGSLEFPPDFDLKAVQGDRAYGVQINELDVPRIDVYRIEWVPVGEGAAS
ncbi:MAG TPA: hypothetical protein VF188_12830 [Longimicrobiales bacterium]